MLQLFWRTLISRVVPRARVTVTFRWHFQETREPSTFSKMELLQKLWCFGTQHEIQLRSFHHCTLHILRTFWVPKYYQKDFSGRRNIVAMHKTKAIWNSMYSKKWLAMVLDHVPLQWNNICVDLKIVEWQSSAQTEKYAEQFKLCRDARRPFSEVC